MWMLYSMGLIAIVKKGLDNILYDVACTHSWPPKLFKDCRSGLCETAIYRKLNSSSGLSRDLNCFSCKFFHFIIRPRILCFAAKYFKITASFKVSFENSLLLVVVLILAHVDFITNFWLSLASWKLFLEVIDQDKRQYMVATEKYHFSSIWAVKTAG